MAKVLKKFLALVLVLAVIMSMTGMTAFAMDDDETIVETEAAPVEETTVEENDALVEDETPVEENDEVEDVVEPDVIDAQSEEPVMSALETAIADGATEFTMTEDITVEGTLVILGRDFTLDLNGHTLTVGTMECINSDLTVLDGSIVRGSRVVDQNGNTKTAILALNFTSEKKTVRFENVTIQSPKEAGDNNFAVDITGIAAEYDIKFDNCDINGLVHFYGADVELKDCTLDIRGYNPENAMFDVTNCSVTVEGGIYIGDGNVLLDDIRPGSPNGSPRNSTLVVKGGTFSNVEKNETFVDDGCKIVDNGDDTWTVVSKYVAQIVGGDAYETLADAIAAAEDGDTVVLLADVTTNAIIAVNKSITIEGDNHAVNSTATRILWIDADDVTVTLNNIEFKSDVAERGVQVNVGKTGVVLNINNCTVPGTYYAVNMCSNTSVALNISDSTIHGWGALNLWGNNYEVKVTNSTLIGHNDKGYNAAGWNGFGVVVLEGDTTGKTDEHVSGCHVVLEDCHIIASTNVNADGNGNIQKVILFNTASTNNMVEIIGDNTVVEYEQGDLTPFCKQNGTDNTLVVAGGVYSTDVTEYCVEGYEAKDNNNGTWTVVKKVDYDAIEITPDRTSLTGAGTVTLTVTGVDDVVDEVIVTGKDVTGSGAEVTVTSNGDNTYTASLPNTTATYVFRVDIGDIFKGEDAIPPQCYVSVTRYVAPAPVTPVTPSEPEDTDEPTVEIEDDETALADRPWLFEDVHEDDWFYGDVKNIFDNGLINGTTTTTYEPQTELSRGMIVTILWRIAGEPTVETTSTFTDVPENAYYFDAINWGAENNIARGYDAETFAPDKLVSREELAAFIYRYAELIELDLNAIDEDAFADFEDADSVQDFAVTAMKWAITASIINGDNGMLRPQDTATRAEAAAMINRFIRPLLEADAENETEAE